jgi:glycosyltransferase involved in cell wall biosynthesis
VGGVPEVIDHEVNGYLYELGDKKSLVDYMIRLLNDEELKNRLGKAGREKVVNSFSGSEIAEEYIEWYKKVLNN